ncbi:hypothetical protein OEZ86_008024 [Tetradesmus obliquus]|nr:hypothetical protein OEZ86_008024 [Tetradesmus obliquus]
MMLPTQLQFGPSALPATAAAGTNLLQDISRLVTLHRSGHSGSSVAKGFRNYVSTALQLCDGDEEASGHASSSKRRRVDALLPAPSQLLRSLQASHTSQAKQLLAERCLRQDRTQALLDWHKAEAAEHQRRREEAAAARLAALKTASLPEYLALLRQAKNGRLQEVLGQTDACLRQLAEKLGVAEECDPATCDAAASAADDSNNEAGVLDSSAAWIKLAAQLPADIPEQPTMVKGGTLREYQMQGLRWLVGLTQRGLNGILADDMGLGKTLQVISMVCHSVEVQQCASPFLIVSPASVLSNWAQELQHWAPDLSVVQYRGSADAREEIYRKQVRKKHFHVLLTTYELLMSEADRARLVKVKWQGIVVDEGHRLKNSDCKLAQQLRGYTSRSRLLLTGTPLQNKLGELWALLNFLMPDVFSSADDFDAWFGAPLQAIKAAGSAAATAAGSAAEASMLNQEEYLLVTNRLHAVLRPFMLRRLKESVATELPQKSEVVLRCRLGPYQSALYHLVKSKLRAEDGEGAGVKGINNTVMELRNICNHPLLSKLHPDFGEDLLQRQPASSSGPSLPAVLRLSCKVDLLDQVLTRLAAGRHRVLLFCTMTRVLDALEEYCGWRGWEWERLDGNTGGQERADAIKRFSNPSSGVFLFMLSLRAGGVGLNLQAADTVIMYDSDWNPQIDLQAQARAHRIGQKQKVLVVRLLTEGSIEEHILAVAEQKRKFADSSITGGFFDGTTSAEARRQYLLSILDSKPPGSSGSGGGEASSSAAAGAESDSVSDDVMTARKLNELLARSPEELQMLQEREQRLAADQAWQMMQQQQQQVDKPAGDSSAAAAAAAAAAKEPWDEPLCRLATAEEYKDSSAAAAAPLAAAAAAAAAKVAAAAEPAVEELASTAESAPLAAPAADAELVQPADADDSPTEGAAHAPAAAAAAQPEATAAAEPEVAAAAAAKEPSKAALRQHPGGNSSTGLVLP